MQQQHLPRVGVFPFTSLSPAGEVVGAGFGTLGLWCAADLERRMVDLGEGRFSVLDRRRLQEAVYAEKFGISQLGSGDALRQLSDRVGGLPVVVEGTLLDRKGRTVSLQCKLKRTDTGDVIESAGGLAAINISEWASFGHSVVIAPEDRRPDVSTPGHRSRPLADLLIERLDEYAKDPHPLKDPSFPLRLRLMVGNEERKGVFRNNDYLVPLRVGEEYSIEVENNTGREILMRLLVDGLNTLPQAADAKGLGTMEVAPRVNIDSARHWSLDPKFGKLFRISGFVTNGGAQGEWLRFRVARAEKSLAAQKQFTDQLGLITAAFYYPAGDPRGVIGTEAAEAEGVSVIESGSTKVGNTVTTITIRYVDPDELKLVGK